MKSSWIRAWAAFCGSWSDRGFLLLSDFSTALCRLPLERSYLYAQRFKLWYYRKKYGSRAKGPVLYFLVACSVDIIWRGWSHVRANPCVFKFGIVARIVRFRKLIQWAIQRQNWPNSPLIGRKLPHSLLQLAHHSNFRGVGQHKY